MENVLNFLREARSLIDAELESLVPPVTVGPVGLRDAMRWSLLGGGKRFRPALLIAVGRAFGADDRKLIRTGVSVEILHTYSLIHDDLPAMDDDDLRRGRATCHKQFDEATAILAGDALQAMAFRVVSEDKQLPPEMRLRLINELSHAAAEMVTGQHLDLDAEGQRLDLTEIERIHRGKTGALVRFSARAGAIIAGASEPDIESVSKYGESLGLLFQVTDDILDITQTSVELGKTAGKDAAAKKATYPNILGVDASRRLAETLCAEASKQIAAINGDSQLLIDICRLILERRS